MAANGFRGVTTHAYHDTYPKGLDDALVKRPTSFDSVIEILFERGFTVADIVEKYLHKGSKIYVEGKLRTRKWQTRDGQDRYSTEVVVDINGNMQMLDARPVNQSPETSSFLQATSREPRRPGGLKARTSWILAID